MLTCIFRIHIQNIIFIYLILSYSERQPRCKLFVCAISFCKASAFVGIKLFHWSDVTIGAIVSKIIGISTICPGAHQRKYQSFQSLAFVRGILRSTVDAPHEGPVTLNMFPRRHHIHVLIRVSTHVLVKTHILYRLTNEHPGANQFIYPNVQMADLL